MLKSRFAKLGAAGFAAVAGLILVASSVGANHGAALGSLSSFTGLASTTEQAGTKVDKDAAADAAALAADTQAEAQAEAAKEAAEKAAALAAAQQKATAEAAEDAADKETADTETGDTETGVQSGGESTESAPPGTETGPKKD